MDKITEIRQKRAKLWEDTKDFLNTHEDKNGKLSAEDTATYERMEADIADMGRQISRLERQQEIDRELSAAVSTPLTSKPDAGAKAEKTGLAGEEYSENFWGVMRNREITPTMRNALQIGTDTEGGFLVPDEFESRIIEALVEENPFRSLATVIRSSHGDRKIPIVTATGEAAWVEEEALIPESDDTFGQMFLGAHKLATLVKVSEELLNDSAFDLETFIARQFAKRIGVKEEEAFINGDGSGKPTGILHDTLGAKVGVEAAADNITFDDIIDLFYSVKKPYRKNAVWLCNESSIKELRKLKDDSGNYLWQPSLVGGSPDTILGCKLVTTAAMPEIGTDSKPVAFGDMSYYWIADRQNRKFKRLNEIYATTGQVGFLATQRVDGKLTLPEAVKVLKTVS